MTPMNIQPFADGRSFVLVGASSSGKGFGSLAYKELKKRGREVFAVHPTAPSIHGDPCWPSIAAVPNRPDCLVVVVSPDRTEGVIKEAAAAGVKHVWIQQGAESPAALATGQQLGLNVVHGHCILMVTEPVGSIHKVHRWIWKVLGKLPA